MKAQTYENAMQRVESAPEHYAGMIDNPHPRFAVIRGARTVEQALAYLPNNYGLMESFEVEGIPTASGRKELWIVIGGYDNAGWTLDGYVLPRLASGLIFGEEIGKGTEPDEEELPSMKELFQTHYPGGFTEHPDA